MSKNLLKEDVAFLKEAKNKLESNIFLEQAAGLTMLIDQIAHMEGRLHNKAVEVDGAKPCASKHSCGDWSAYGPKICLGCTTPRNSL